MKLFNNYLTNIYDIDNYIAEKINTTKKLLENNFNMETDDNVN